MKVSIYVMACTSQRGKRSRLQERKPISTKKYQRMCRVSQFMLSNVLPAGSFDKARDFPMFTFTLAKVGTFQQRQILRRPL